MTAPHLLVGCPVLRREWILPHWFEYLERACQKYGTEPSYVFVTDRRDPSREVIDSYVNQLGRSVTHVEVLDRVDSPHSHAWANEDNLHKMVQLRNLLLEAVREIDPHMFLSLDSDILCHEDFVVNMVDTLMNHERGFSAVGGKVYLGSGVNVPSWCFYDRTRGMKRYDVDYVMEVDVIMAAKLMSPSAFGVDYEFNHHGEDIGWSLACAERGLRLGFDGRVASKHVMFEKDGSGASLIQKVDSRVGF